MKLQTKISALVVVHNEEKKLASCMDTLWFVDEIVVLLDKCIDRSKEIAASYTDKLIEGEWEVEGDRRNCGIKACNCEWILEIDADEKITDILAREILDVITTTNSDRHDIPVDNHVGGRLIRFGWGASFGRGAHTALFKKGCKIWGNERVHPKLFFRGTKGKTLENAIYHDVDENISGLIKKLDSYSSANALDLRESGNIGSLGHNIRRIFSRFYKCYVSRRGYKEGCWGFLIALLASLYPIISYLKANLED